MSQTSYCHTHNDSLIKYFINKRYFKNKILFLVTPLHNAIIYLAFIYSCVLYIFVYKVLFLVFFFFSLFLSLFLLL